jgi:hypothetical protein
LDTRQTGRVRAKAFITSASKAKQQCLVVDAREELLGR